MVSGQQLTRERAARLGVGGSGALIWLTVTVRGLAGTAGGDGA